MGLFKKLGAFLESFNGPQPTVVVVAYRDLVSPVTEDYLDKLSGRYNFRWELPQAPDRGTRVKVPGGDGRLTDGVVLRIATADDLRSASSAGYSVSELKKVHRLISSEEVEKATNAEKRNAESWLRMARRAAGLPTKGKGRQAPPPGYPPIAPIEGGGDIKHARDHVRMWHQAKKLAVKYNHDPDEVQRFDEIVKYWRKIQREQP